MSRLKSSRGASRPAPARGGRPGVFVQTPQSDIYVAMLGIALGAIILGCLLLVLHLNSYEWSLKVSAVTPSSGAALASVNGPDLLSENLSTIHL